MSIGIKLLELTKENHEIELLPPGVTEILSQSVIVLLLPGVAVTHSSGVTEIQPLGVNLSLSPGVTEILSPRLMYHCHRV
jgi:hypothetical protein